MPLNKTVPCYPARDAVSNGVLQGDNPTQFALPLLIIQIGIVLLITRTMSYLIKPLRQPRVLAEVIGGVLLGPSGFGRNHAFSNTIFPKSSLTTIDTVSTLGLLFFLFMVGLELDLEDIRKSGKAAALTALSGIAVPFIAGIGLSSLLHQHLSVNAHFAPLVVFMGVPISITAFPVLVRILAERKLLNTELGKKVLPTAAINDVCAWILLAVGVAISGSSSNPATPAYVLLCGVGFVVVMLLFVRRIMEWIAHRASAQEAVSEIYVCLTMVGVLVSGFTTDFIGIHPLFGAFVFGMIVPKEGKFAQMLTEKIEDFVTVLFLPLFFASSGLKTNLSSISSFRAIGLLLLLVITATVGKISATMVAGLMQKMDMRKALAFGFLMNTKGLVELIVLNIGKDLGVFDDQTFAILVLMCLIMLFFTTPAVMALYKPARSPLPYTNRKLEGSNFKKDELRILACIHGTKCIPPTLNLIEAAGSTKRKLRLYAMHLIEFSGRTSSLIGLSRSALHGGDSTSSPPNEDNLLVPFEAYGRLTKVPVKLSSIVSEFTDMHDDVCATAAERRATIIILPFNIYQRTDGSIEYTNQGFSTVNQRVLEHAPCSVGVLVDRGLWGSAQLSESSIPYEVAVLFFGGADDREAVAFGLRLAEHPNVSLSLVRFLPSEKRTDFEHVIDVGSQNGNGNVEVSEDKLDEQCIAVVKDPKGEDKTLLQSISYQEVSYQANELDSIVSMVRLSDFALVIVGKVSNYSTTNSSHHADNNELGIVGDALASIPGHDVKTSVLVIQQHKSIGSK